MAQIRANRHEEQNWQNLEDSKEKPMCFKSGVFFLSIINTKSELIKINALLLPLCKSAFELNTDYCLVALLGLVDCIQMIALL